MGLMDFPGRGKFVNFMGKLEQMGIGVESLTRRKR